MIPRAGWNARAPRAQQGRSLGQIQYVVVHHSESSPPANHDYCPASVRAFQDYHLDGQGWSDIGYNRIVCPHGEVYEGRPLLVVASAAPMFNTNGCHYCFIDNGDQVATIEARRALVDQIAADDLANRERKCHRDVTQTSCPGDGNCEWVHAGMPLEGVPVRSNVALYAAMAND